MNSNQIAVLSIGLSIFVFVTYFLVYFNLYRKDSTFTKDSIFTMKKITYISFVLLANVGMCVLVYYLQNLQVIVYIMLILKSKDLISSLIFVPHIIYKHFSQQEINIQNVIQNETQIENIVAFVPVYKETLEELSRTVDSIIANNVSLKYILTCIVSDGLNNYKNIIDEMIITKSNVYYKGWRGISVCTNVYFGIRGSKHILLIEKVQNQGKKDSIILVNNIFNNFSKLDDYSKEIASTLMTAFGVNTFDYMFSTDADTVLEVNTIESLIDSVKKRNANASCGIVNVYNNSGNWLWNNLQNYQYLYGQYMRRTTEDLFGQVLCLPGCVSLVRMNQDLKTSQILYSYIPEKDNFIVSTVQYVGTDRRYTGSLLYTNSNVKCVMDIRCNAYTTPPQTFTSYLSQRRRWCQNTYFNTMINIIAPNINPILRFFCFIDYLRLTFVYFRLFNTIFFIYLLATEFTYRKILELVPFIVVLIYPTLFFFTYCIFNKKLRSQLLDLFLSYLINKIFILFSNIIVFTTMIFNVGYDSWSQINTTQV